LRFALRRFVERRRTAGWLAAICLGAAFLAPSLHASVPRGDDASGLLQAAQRQFDAGNFSAAITTLQSATSQNPSNAAACYWLGRSYYEIRDYDNAVAQAEKSVALDAKNSLYHQWLGRTYGGKADRDRSFFLARKVKKEFEEAVRLNPANISARRDLEEYCLEAPWIVGGSKEEAMAQVNAIASLDPVEGHLARAFYNLSTTKKPEQAEAEYRQVLAAKPARFETYLEVADFYVRQSQAADVQSTVQAAAQLSSNDARLAFYRGVAGVLANGDLAVAERDLKSYVASTPDRSDWPSHAAARVWLGKLYEAQGKRPQAAEQYRAALQLNPQHKEARSRLNQLGKAAP
jgi:tetratricopeptide (TPR) repeat protein